MRRADLIHADTHNAGKTSGNGFYGLLARLSIWGKPRVKRVLVTGYCWGVLPAQFVAWAFKRWDLAKE